MEISGEWWGVVSDYRFSGLSALALDAKGRVTVPARQREVLAGIGQTKLIVTKHKTRCLLLMPQVEWDKMAAQLETLPMEAESMVRLYFGSMTEVEIDSASRILIPPELRRWAYLERDVMLVGMNRRLELWDAARHAAAEEALLAGDLPEAAKGLRW